MKPVLAVAVWLAFAALLVVACLLFGRVLLATETSLSLCDWPDDPV